MEENTTVGVVSQVKDMLNSDKIKSRFTDVMGAKANQFMASITNVVSGSKELKECNPTSIIGAAFIAATYDLPIDSNLGFSALVPYNRSYKVGKEWKKEKLAQFQIMYKGFIQLAGRTGSYKTMNCSAVYEDELVSYNPIMGECKFVDDFSKCTQRAEGRTERIIGYYAMFELLTGFRKELYMTVEQLYRHANKFSKSYQYDVSNNKQNSKWSNDFESMALKTVIKLLISKWGLLSIEMQGAITDDQKIFENEEDSGEYIDNQEEIEIVHDAFEIQEDGAMTEEA